MTNKTLLNYQLTSSPNPLVAGASDATLTLVCAPGPLSNPSIESITVKIPIGDQPYSLIVTGNDPVSGFDHSVWSDGKTATTFTFTPLSGEPIELSSPTTFTFSGLDIVKNSVVSGIEIVEVSEDKNNPDDSMKNRLDVIEIGVFPAEFELISFYANPTTVENHCSSTLSWSTAGAESLNFRLEPANLFTNLPDPLPPNENGLETNPLTANATFTLSVGNKKLGTTAQAIVTVNVPAIQYFNAIPGRVGLDEAIDLSWSTTFVDLVTITANNVVIAENLDASTISTFRVSSIDVDTTFTIQALNSNSVPYDGITLSTQVFLDKPEILTFEIVTANVYVGSPVTLSWTSKNATECILEYSNDNGDSYIEIATVSCNETDYVLQPEQLIVNNGLLRLTGLNNQTKKQYYSDLSNGLGNAEVSDQSSRMTTTLIYDECPLVFQVFRLNGNSDSSKNFIYDVTFDSPVSDPCIYLSDFDIQLSDHHKLFQFKISLDYSASSSTSGTASATVILDDDSGHSVETVSWIQVVLVARISPDAIYSTGNSSKLGGSSVDMSVNDPTDPQVILNGWNICSNHGDHSISGMTAGGSTTDPSITTSNGKSVANINTYCQLYSDKASDYSTSVETCVFAQLQDNACGFGYVSFSAAGDYQFDYDIEDYFTILQKYDSSKTGKDHQLRGFLVDEANAEGHIKASDPTPTITVTGNKVSYLNKQAAWFDGSDTFIGTSTNLVVVTYKIPQASG